jgi:hypothetical protein
MALSLAEVVRQFKADVGLALSPAVIVRLCQSVGYEWRKRILDPVTTIQVFLLQILHGNTACSGLPHLAGLSFTAAAYCAARLRLPLTLFEDLLEFLTDAVTHEIDQTGRWCGHRTWLVDGSGFSMSDTPALEAHFGQPGGQAPGCGFPVARILGLFHAGTGLLLRVLAAPLRTHDMAMVARVHPEMESGDVLVGDRGLASYAHLALLFQRGLHGVFRGHQKQIVNFRRGRQHTRQRNSRKGLPRSRWVRRLGRWDQLVEYTKPTSKPVWIDPAAWDALPTTLLVRETRYRTPQRGRRTRVITLVTTLTDAAAYPAADLAELYQSRWRVEVNFRHLKTTLGMDVLHCRTVDGVTKELLMFAIVYNLIRLVMLEASRRQQAPLERISFVDAWRWLRTAQPGTPLPALRVNPDRPDRIEPRVLKRRPKQYPLMTKPRAQLRKVLERNNLAA